MVEKPITRLSYSAMVISVDKSSIEARVASCEPCNSWNIFVATIFVLPTPE